MKRTKRGVKRKQRSVTGAAIAGMLMLLMSMVLAVVNPPQRAAGGVKEVIVAAFQQGVQSYMAFEAEHGTLD